MRTPSIRAAMALIVVVIVLPNGAARAAPCWNPPVAAPVTDPFREPTCRWCPGNRGIEYGTGRGEPVRAVASGRVTFSGAIAGTRYVVVRHGDGRRITYGNLASAAFGVDDLVIRGQLIGRTAGRFHLGLRNGTRYIDPTPFIGVLVRQPRLIPADGRAGNEAPPARLRCSARSSANWTD